MWQLINREIGKAPENNHKLQLKIENKITSNPTEITEKLNVYFISTVEELVKENSNRRCYNKLEIKHCPNSIFIHPVTEEEVISLTKSLKGKPTAAYDDTPERLVKQCMQLTKWPLAHIYNVLLKSGVFPDEWKTAKVKPLYKKGDTYDTQNYRPISAISVFAKLLERLMYNRITSFLYENKIFTEAQNCFRKGKCIETAVHSFNETIQEALDKQVCTIGTFFDLTKAHDVLNHKLLLEKLSSYCIRAPRTLGLGLI